MRILLIGPDHPGGSIPPYLDVLADAMRGLGVRVDRLGSTGLPYDAPARRFWPAEQILRAAEALLSGVDLDWYDLISVHFGNLEIEQLLPYLWRTRSLPPVVYHVHSLDWTLFSRHVLEPRLYAAVVEGVRGMGGYLFFGNHARIGFTAHLGNAASAVTWLPTTMRSGTRADASPALAAVLPPGGGPVGTLYGYPAPWKDIPGLLAACRRTAVDCRIVLAGPFWDNPRQAGTGLEAEIATGVHHGRACVRVAAEYLGPSDRRALVAASDFGTFPYRPHPSFQGSGAIADYLAHGRPVIVTDVANMSELVGDAGIIVPTDQPDELASALDRLSSCQSLRCALARRARERSHRFKPSHHAAECLRFYEAVANRLTTTGARP